MGWRRENSAYLYTSGEFGLSSLLWITCGVTFAAKGDTMQLCWSVDHSNSFKGAPEYHKLPLMRVKVSTHSQIMAIETLKVRKPHTFDEFTSNTDIIGVRH